jgi:hypothetical protein
MNNGNDRLNMNDDLESYLQELEISKQEHAREGKYDEAENIKN